MIDHLALDRREETLGHRIVPTVSFSAHARHHAQIVKGGSGIRSGSIDQRRSLCSYRGEHPGSCKQNDP